MCFILCFQKRFLGKSPFASPSCQSSVAQKWPRIPVIVVQLENSKTECYLCSYSYLKEYFLSVVMIIIEMEKLFKADQFWPDTPYKNVFLILLLQWLQLPVA